MAKRLQTVVELWGGMVPLVKELFSYSLALACHYFGDVQGIGFGYRRGEECDGLEPRYKNGRERRPVKAEVMSIKCNINGGEVLL